MAETGTTGAPATRPLSETDTEALIDALRARGAERFDPVGFRFIEALARRAAAQGHPARQLLDRRLAQALTEYGERFDRLQREARDAFARGSAQFPEAADALRQHCDAGDFGALHRLLAKLEAQAGSRPLAELLAHVGRQAPQDTTSGLAHASEAKVEPHSELKSVKVFRRTWSRLRVDQQLSDALAQAPENAGPLNSHSLVLRSLKLMRDISPEYLEQFTSYIDALLWLEQAGSGGSSTQKNAVRGERGGKRKPGRGIAG